MFGIRVAAFIISVLLLTHSVVPSDGWFIVLVVLTGLSLFAWSARVPRIYIGPRLRRLRWLDEW